MVVQKLLMKENVALVKEMSFLNESPYEQIMYIYCVNETSIYGMIIIIMLCS